MISTFKPQELQHFSAPQELLNEFRHMIGMAVFDQAL